MNAGKHKSNLQSIEEEEFKRKSGLDLKNNTMLPRRRPLKFSKKND